MNSTQFPVIGWREYISLNDLKIPEMKVKVDTGAKTSSIHAKVIETYHRGSKEFILFEVELSTKENKTKKKKVARCRSEVVSYRKVKSSNGHVEKRPIIQTTISLKEQKWTIELNLTDRSEMGFPMLLGRDAIKKRFLVDSAKSFTSKKIGNKRK